MKEHQGWWWRPEDPTVRVPGTLHVGVDGVLTLELVGGFSISEIASTLGGATVYTPTIDRFPVLHGVCQDKPMTLIDCVPSSTIGGVGTGDIKSQQISALRAYRGIHLASEASPAFDTAIVEIEYMLAWSRDRRHSPVQLSWLLDRENPEPASQQPKRVAHHGPYTIGLESWKDRDIRQRPRLSTTTTTIVEHASLSIERTGGAPASDFDAVIKAFMDLLTVAANAPAGVISRTLLPPRSEPIDDGETFDAGRHEVEVLGRQVHVVAADDGNSHHQYLFTLENIDFADLVPRWLRLHDQLWLPISMLAGLHYVRGGYDSERLLIAAAAAEGIHRQLYPDEQPYEDVAFERLREQLKNATPKPDRSFVNDRIKNTLTFKDRLMSLSKKPDEVAVQALIADIPTWAAFVRDHRNGVAHASRDRLDTHDAVRVHDAQELTVGLLALVLMQQLGLSAEVQRAVPNLPGITYSARRMRSDLA